MTNESMSQILNSSDKHWRLLMREMDKATNIKTSIKQKDREKTNQDSKLNDDREVRLDSYEQPVSDVGDEDNVGD